MATTRFGGTKPSQQRLDSTTVLPNLKDLDTKSPSANGLKQIKATPEAIRVARACDCRENDFLRNLFIGP